MYSNGNPLLCSTLDDTARRCPRFQAVSLSLTRESGTSFNAMITPACPPTVSPAILRWDSYDVLNTLLLNPLVTQSIVPCANPIQLRHSIPTELVWYASFVV